MITSCAHLPCLLRQLLSWPMVGAVFVLAAAGGMAAALVAQYIFDLQPCVLCLWQRAPLIALGVLGGIGLWPRATKFRPVITAAIILLALIAAGIAFFHVGVEQHWWLGTAGCAVGAPTPDNVAALRMQLLLQDMARCDQVSWTFLGLSMATWNIPFSLGLAGYGGLHLLMRCRTDDKA